MRAIPPINGNAQFNVVPVLVFILRTGRYRQSMAGREWAPAFRHLRSR